MATVSRCAAIIAANNTAGTDTIAFNITGTGPHTINMLSQLPYFSDTVILDGWTEPDYAGTPVIVLNGASAGGTARGLDLYAGSDGSTIRGLVFQNFGDIGINVSDSVGHTIVGNYIGTNAAGTAAAGNYIGLNFWNSSNNTIGGTTPAARNLISGNTNLGLYMGGTSDNNVIQGNYIGTNAAGTGAIGNTNYGMLFDSSDNNTIGGLAAGAGNVISGNGGRGMSIWNGSTGNVVQGNLIGTNAAGTAALGNGYFGLEIDNAFSNTIGGTTSAARNVISGNTDDGIAIFGASSTGNVVQGNYIGTDITGLIDLGNGADGIDINTSASANTIGGSAAGAGNVISGNTLNGIRIATSSSNVIQGNYIGVGSDGVTAVGNTNDGVGISGTSNANQIGGVNAGEGNIIANGTASTAAGVWVNGGTNNSVLGNKIYSNGNTTNGMGINLGTGGITANDNLDPDTGPNNYQNFPVLTSAAVSTSGTNVVGSLNSNASTTYRIEFFANRPGVADSTNGEGRTYLGYTTVTTNGSGNASFNVTLDAWINSGDKVTATATVDFGTGSYGSTSEFAANVTATSAANIIVVDTTSDVSDGTVTSITNLRARCGRRDLTPRSPRSNECHGRNGLHLLQHSHAVVERCAHDQRPVGTAGNLRYGDHRRLERTGLCVDSHCGTQRGECRFCPGAEHHCEQLHGSRSRD